MEAVDSEVVIRSPILFEQNVQGLPPEKRERGHAKRVRIRIGTVNRHTTFFGLASAELLAPFDAPWPIGPEDAVGRNDEKIIRVEVE